jgi:hypothetical protein
MQTFLPYSSFIDSAKSLDNKRLGKQRLESYQILKALEDTSYGWQHHPAVLMWKGYEDALKMYYNCVLSEWIRRGFKNSMSFYDLSCLKGEFPSWIGNEDFHKSHRSNLLRKDYEFYSKQFSDVDANLPYYWPSKVGTTQVSNL